MDTSVLFNTYKDNKMDNEEYLSKIFNSDDYKDIYDAQYPSFHKYPKITMNDRAAQFASFEALEGLEQVLLEQAKSATSKISLDVNMMSLVIKKLQNWKEILDSGVMPIVTHFVWDEGKDVNTGHYIQTMCQARVIDENSGIITLDDKSEICIDDILVIEGISV